LVKKYGRTATLLKYLAEKVCIILNYINNSSTTFFIHDYLKNVDLVAFAFDQVSFHLTHMEVAPILWIESMGMIQPWPEEQSRLLVV